MKKFSMSLALSLIKAAILTIIIVGTIASLSSCGKIAHKDRVVTNIWRATVIKTNRTITVKNTDSLSVMSGDTVTVFYSDGCGGQPSYYYISNSANIASDTSCIEIYVDGKDTSYVNFQAWNVVLQTRIIK